jgi:APA family basic amino acid/polyamine antiporter
MAPPAETATPAATSPTAPRLVRRLGLLDVTLIAMGGVIGSGIFVSPSFVAARAGSVGGILGAWVLGGAIALAGAFVFAELGARRPEAGGQYAYLREAWHPSIGFLYAWALLLLIQTGGMAASAMTFARYVRELGHVPLSEGAISGLVLFVLTLVNVRGVRVGASTQNVLMVLKLAALLAVIVTGLMLVGAAVAPPVAAGAPTTPTPDSSGGFAAAMVAVLFSYGGAHTAGFLGGEVKDPARTLPRGMVLGVVGVVVIYLLVNLACLRVLGVQGLAASTAPAAEVMRRAFGETGARLLALGVAPSTLGFLSQCMLTAPRVYWAMAADGLFFKSVAHVDPRTGAPVVAVVLQGLAATIMALTGEYGRILDTVVSTDWVFFALTAIALFVLRRRDHAAGRADPALASGHPWTTLGFLAACTLIVIAALAHDPKNGAIGFALMLAGLPVYLVWRRRAAAIK